VTAGAASARSSAAERVLPLLDQVWHQPRIRRRELRNSERRQKRDERTA